MSILFVLDPGANAPAVAVFRDGVLLGAERAKVHRSWARLDPGARVVRVAEACWDLLAAWTPDEVAYEHPKVYPGSRGKADPADLILLALQAGAFLSKYPRAQITKYFPSEWIGGVPKSKTGDPRESARGKRIWGRLTPAEQGVLELSHDAFDACGIGLHHLGRLAPRRVYPGCTE